MTTVWRGCSFFHRGGGPPGEGCMGPGQSLVNKGLLVSADYGNGKKKIIVSCSAEKESTCNAGDLGLTPELGRSSGEGKGNPL